MDFDVLYRRADWLLDVLPKKNLVQVLRCLRSTPGHCWNNLNAISWSISWLSAQRLILLLTVSNKYWGVIYAVAVNNYREDEPWTPYAVQTYNESIFPWRENEINRRENVLSLVYWGRNGYCFFRFWSKSFAVWSAIQNVLSVYHKCLQKEQKVFYYVEKLPVLQIEWIRFQWLADSW